MHVVGVPFTSAGRTDEEARAPGVLRAAGLVPRLRAATGGEVADLGDAATARPDPGRDPASGLLAPGAWAKTTAAARAAVARGVTPQGRTLVLGGDCSVLPGALAGAQDALGGSVGLLFVDGHEDAWPPRESTTGEAADCELGLLLGDHRDGLPAGLRRDVPVLDEAAVVVLGPRDGDEIAGAGVPSLAGRVPFVPAGDLTGDDAAAHHTADAVRHLEDATAHWWLHVDLDVLAGHALPAVDYPQEGGLEWSQLRAVLTTALRAPGCRGLTVCIYDPDLDPDGTHAATIVDELAGCVAAATGADR